MNKANFFRASAEDFKKIPGSPVAYWAGELIKAFENPMKVSSFSVPRAGFSTGNNDKFLRLWFEVSHRQISFGLNSQAEFIESGLPYVPCKKGGYFRRWFGDSEYIVKWNCSGEFHRARTTYLDSYFKESISWNAISSGRFHSRYCDTGFLFDHAAAFVVPYDSVMAFIIQAFMSTNVFDYIIKILNPTINNGAEIVSSVPMLDVRDYLANVLANANSCVNFSRVDWNAYETSWDFAVNPLVAELNNPVNPVNPVEESEMVRSVSGASDKSAFQLSALYAAVRARWAKSCEEMRRLETENNRIFIEAYGLQDELTPEVPWHEITLTCNPWYRYGVKEVEKVGGGGDSFPLNPELEARLKSDTVKELISYAVGCMMGRYAIDKPGLILADQGSTYGDYLAKVSEPEFDPDEDGIIPVIDEDCFADDIVIQFHKFLRTAFGAANFNANLSFIEEAIGKDLRSYFTKDFYADHLQRYQKRPIYWLFSSPKGTFSALVYLHRYHPGTVGQVLTYLRSHITNHKSRLDAADRTTADPSATQGMKTKAIKERTKLMRQLKELEDYERDVLHPLASERLEIDLDDGVKVNYPKFGKALRKIPGFE